MVDPIRRSLSQPLGGPAKPRPEEAPKRPRRQTSRLMARDGAALGERRDRPVDARPPLAPNSPAGKLWRLANSEDVQRNSWPGGSLAAGVNAHATNTVEQMKDALESDHHYNWLEGDVRREIDDKGKLEMRHDSGHESGDNLTLREWLEVGKASGKGLKLDIKEADAVPEVLRMAREVGVDPARLMINVGDGAIAKYGELIRKELPGAIVAINPADALGERKNADGPYEPWQVDRMRDHARQLGEPVTFVLRHDRITPDVVEDLEAVGPVSVWNSPDKGGVGDPEREAEQLRELGISGVIDLRKSMSNLEKADAVVDRGVQEGKNLLRKGWEAVF